MAGMLQILTYLLSFYLVIKGVEVLQIGLASNRNSRSFVIGIGIVTLVACVLAAFAFTSLQDTQALSISHATSHIP
jgi:hypothetical protein